MENLPKQEDQKNDLELFKALRKSIDKPLKYDTSQITGLSEEFIKEKHNKLEHHYKEVDDLIKEDALMWCATKEGCAPIYLYETTHQTYNFVKER